MAKKKKGQTMIYTTLHRKVKIEQHEPHYKHSSVLLVTKSTINILSVVLWLLLYCTSSLLLVTYSTINILSVVFWLLLYCTSSLLLVTYSTINILSVVFWLLLYSTSSLLLVTYSTMNILSAFFIGDSNVHGDESLRKPGVELEYSGMVRNSCFNSGTPRDKSWTRKGSDLTTKNETYLWTVKQTFHE